MVCRNIGFRSCSPYLASALAMLLGCYLSIHEGSVPWSNLRFVFFSQFAYQLMLLAILSYLIRVKRSVAEAIIVCAILGAFVLDVLMIQQLYDWERGPGLAAGLGGTLRGLLLIGGVAAAFRDRRLFRLLAVSALMVIFIHLGPYVLVGAQSESASNGYMSLSAGLSRQYVMLGWLFSATLLPILLQTVKTNRNSNILFQTLELWGLFLVIGIGFIHLFLAGIPFNLQFRWAYLAPFVVLSMPALGRLVPDSKNESFRIFNKALPFVGISLAATRLAPPLWNVFRISEGPLSPLWLVLVLASIVFLCNYIWNHDASSLVAGAVPLAMILLGGNVPEILLSIRYPVLWQVAGVLAICLFAELRGGTPKHAMILHLVPSMTAAGWLAERGTPWSMGILLGLAWGPILLESGSRSQLRPAMRLGLGLFLTVPAVILVLQQPDIGAVLALAAVQCLGLLLVGLLRKDKLFSSAAIASLTLAVLAYPIAFQKHGEVSAGKMCVELAFLLLLLGFANSVFGDAVQNALRRSLADEN